MSSSRATSPMGPSRPGMLTPRHPTPSPAPHPPPRSPSATIFPSRPTPLHLTVRFSTSVPDLQLDILNPNQTTVVALKHLIRSRLSDPNSTRRLRFIHGGKILPDNAVLSAVLKPLRPPPSAAAASSSGDRGHHRGAEASSDPKGKGKNVEGRPAAAAHRVYVNCSIGDVLSGAELEAEALAAARPAPDPKASSSRGGANGSDHSSGSSPGPTAAATAISVGGGGGGEGVTRRTPHGFDRLLTAGFSVAEVNQLRLQFRSIHASRHTPDTMPSPDTLRGMEDAWIDNNDAGTGGGGGGGDDGTGGAGGTDADEGFGLVGLVDVLVKGMVIGFLFPLGSVGWLIREEGLWSSRWQVFVSFGFILSLTIGMIRAISSDK